MSSYIFLALISGIFISLSRSLNGRLSIEKTPFHASTWNHAIGFLFLTVLILYQNPNLSHITLIAPLYSYLGGAIGALFVVTNSLTLKSLGVTKTAMLVISGQMISALVVDKFFYSNTFNLNELLGVTFIIAGVSLSKLAIVK